MTDESRRSVLTRSMQELGLLHIEHEAIDIPEETETLLHEQNQVKRLIHILENAGCSGGQPSGNRMEIGEVIQQLLKINEQTEAIHQEKEQLERNVRHLAPWGNYHFHKFQRLMENGLYGYLCHTDKQSFARINQSDAIVEKINQFGNNVYFVVITQDKDYSPSFEYFPVPKNSPADLAEAINQQQNQLTETIATLQSYSGYLPTLQQYLIKVTDAIALSRAEASYHEHSDGRLISISAWFPAKNEQKVLHFLDRERVAWKIRDPQKEEKVPVVLNNRSYPRLFEPITQIFELPNYNETDLTPFLSVFYPILFAYCLGDAGYGFVLMVLMIAGYFSVFRQTRSIAVLGIILGGVTTVMGFIKSGSLFGIALMSDHPQAWIRQLSQWVMIPDDSTRIFNAFNVALMIGVIQIHTGIAIAIYNKIKYKGYTYALAPVGKLLVVSSLIWIFLADMQEIAELNVLGDFRNYQLISGIVLVVCFHDMDLSLAKRLGGFFMPLFFIFTGILGDILSYVRLFALGLASSVLGLVVNQIGLQIMGEGIFRIILGVVFLVLGHALNFGIAALGSFVHPLRLTFVEFYGNVGFQGKGLTYRPFKKSKLTV